MTRDTRTRLLLILGLMLPMALACSLSTTASVDPSTEIAQVPTNTPAPTQTPFNPADDPGGAASTHTPQPTATPIPTLPDTSDVGNVSPPCVVRSDWPVYVVVTGDTLASIARRAGSSVTELATANCLDDPNTLLAGQQLRVPRVPAPPTPTVPPNDPPVGFRTYDGQEIGVALDYPAHWYISVTTIGLATSVNLTSFDPATGPPAKAGWTPDVVDMKVIWAPAAPSELDAWVESEKEQLLSNPGLELFQEERITLSYGYPAVRLELVSGSGGINTRIYSLYAGRNILISYFSAGDAVAQSVIDTLRPAGQISGAVDDRAATRRDL